MQSYGQFCPVAKAAEILGERWTPLIIRELLCHPQSFNELRNGLPLISPTLLSNRLKTLEHRGVLRRECSEKGVAYCVTDAGEELRTVITEMGVWGQRWARSNLAREDLDPTLLMWDIHRRLDIKHLPAGRTVIRFEFDVCLKDPGYDIDLLIHSPLNVMTGVWMGDRALHEELKSHTIRLAGDTALKESLPDWFLLNVFSGVRPASDSDQGGRCGD
ncbi:helix-turn-helix transcriptional regulator [Marinobacter sp. 71-i]|uniref:Helix-turn-helix transcriptional regulator n=1 Tax=Marinobacter iranensis TaxID=2962607 RepID=A0ABT5Y4P8_9GAMM|nr:helix-turn-helix domain-containing protein [Marinobacter iranensis]MDF0748640.1 helix-turn-helix transcriptional regulator [Marinobacter iranensis]